MIPTADTPGTFQIQTLHGTFLTVKESKKANAGPEVRGDATEINFDTTLRIRMQARFKPKLKASKEKKTKEKTIEKRERLARKKKFGFRKMFMAAQTVRAGQISAEHHASCARRPARAQL